MYSPNRKFLVDEEDEQYLSDNLNEIHDQIGGMIKSVEPNASEDVLSVVNELCSAVYRGDMMKNTMN